MEPSNQISERAVALGTPAERDAGARELVILAGGDIRVLEDARNELVARVRLRSNDFEATSGLRVLNAAIALAGWPDPVAWKPRRWRIPR